MLGANVLIIISNALPKLDGNNKKIAEYVLAHVNEITNSTIAQVAQAINVSESSIIRFCKHIGFRGFPELKMNILQQRATSGSSHFEDMKLDLNTKDPYTITNKVFDNIIQHILITKRMLVAEDITRVIDKLATCDKALFFAVGSSSFITNDAAYRFMRVGFPASSVTDPHSMLLSANSLTENSLAFAISHTGRSKETLEAVKVAKAKKALTVGVSNVRNSPLTKLCDISLIASDISQNFLKEAMTSRLALIALLDSLFTSLMICYYEKYNEKIASMHSTLEKARL